MTNGEWRRVTRKYPCPVCGATGWCAISANGEVCLCMRTESDWPAKQGMGGHFHRLNSASTLPARSRPVRRKTAFHSRMRGTVSDWVVGQLTLDECHYRHLTGAQRHLDDEQIARRRYRSWPGEHERAELAARAARKFGTLMREYPGFYLDRQGLPAFSGSAGLLLPVSDDTANIIAFQIRPDDLTIGKRLWLSSQGRRDGTGSGSPAHFSDPGVLHDPFTSFCVEGVLSADICSDILGCPCIGLSGKTNWRVLDRERLKSSLTERIVIALDQDAQSAGDTEASQLAESLAPDFDIEFARWDGKLAKGFDDCLNLGAPYTIG